uniref:Uncharacterized protein n=1 Tax=Lepeophtheirus salmonis TaxID=72036 RepID=A0A0K2UBZ5_LEPSM
MPPKKLHPSKLLLFSGSMGVLLVVVDVVVISSVVVDAVVVVVLPVDGVIVVGAVGVVEAVGVVVGSEEEFDVSVVELLGGRGVVFGVVDAPPSPESVVASDSESFSVTSPSMGFTVVIDAFDSESSSFFSPSGMIVETYSSDFSDSCMIEETSSSVLLLLSSLLIDSSVGHSLEDP